jgi:hypothetical protein
LGVLRAFLESYTRHDPGLAHEFVMIFNAVTPAEQAAARNLLGECAPYRTLNLAERMVDLAAYKAVIDQIEADGYYFSTHIPAFKRKGGRSTMLRRSSSHTSDL